MIPPRIPGGFDYAHRLVRDEDEDDMRAEFIHASQMDLHPPED
jgi:hypothetical protein